MKKVVIILVVVAAVVGVAFYSGLLTRDSAQAAGAQAPGGQGGRQGGAQAGRQGGGQQGGGRGNRGPLTVEIAKASRGSVSERITVVGNLIGDATVSVVPRVAGRL